MEETFNKCANKQRMK